MSEMKANSRRPARDEFDLEHCSKWFEYHPPVGNQTERYGLLRDAAHQFAEVIVALVPASADRTAALRKLRECVMTANAGIACEEVGTDGVREYTLR